MAGTARDQRFLASTRGLVVALLRRTPHTVDELAALLGITDNAVRSHLSTLERDGLVVQSGLRRTEGKPAHVFSVTANIDRLFPKAYAPVLGQLLDVLGERLPPAEVESTLREVGSRLAAELGPPSHQPIGNRIESAVGLIEELGGLAEVDTLDQPNGVIRIRGSSCPLQEAVLRRAEVCLMLESLLSDVIGAPVKQSCERGAAQPRCCFDVSVRERPAA
jgi:predicted ArsR family transcriptional regulator